MSRAIRRILTDYISTGLINAVVNAAPDRFTNGKAALRACNRLWWSAESAFSVQHSDAPRCSASLHARCNTRVHAPSPLEQPG